MIGGVLAILIIFLFLRDGWSTFVISLSLPVSIITTFFFMGQLGLSLNVMSLGGLALATGLVVDDSIVVLESIAKARERGRRAGRGHCRHPRSEHGGDGVHVDHHCGVPAAGVRRGHRRAVVPRSGIDGGDRDRDLAGGVDDAHSDAELAQGAPPMAFPDEPSHPQWQPEQRWLKPVAAGRRGAGASMRYGFFGRHGP